MSNLNSKLEAYKQKNISKVSAEQTTEKRAEAFLRDISENMQTELASVQEMLNHFKINIPEIAKSIAGNK